MDPEERRRKDRKWRENNPEKVAAIIRRQNAVRSKRVRNAVGEATTAQVRARWDYYGGKCWICGRDATDMDHVKPIAAGGSNWASNLKPACRSCNRAKSAKWPFKPEDIAHIWAA
ncbi:MAG: hypothetical protein A2Y38_25875 [Spirochaetes bacterium GWB1_59_5]|nr:MAG: hypothetical protein A2Y38_25875 [Spirochaetes bacterium GWB1_59_5]